MAGDNERGNALQEYQIKPFKSRRVVKTQTVTEGQFIKELRCWDVLGND